MNLEYQFQLLLQCIRESKVSVRNIKRGEPFDINNPNHIKAIKARFIDGRKPKHPAEPRTITDSAYLEVMISYYDRKEPRELIEEIHKIAMASENIVGEILERYIANELEPYGWVWASGAVLHAVDFVYRQNDGTWAFLQVKNRDNSENSSSQSVRNGTTIKKWFRSFSVARRKRATNTNWEGFPDLPEGAALTEKDFVIYLREYLQNLRLAS